MKKILLLIGICIAILVIKSLKIQVGAYVPVALALTSITAIGAAIRPGNKTPETISDGTKSPFEVNLKVWDMQFHTDTNNKIRIHKMNPAPKKEVEN